MAETVRAILPACLREVAAGRRNIDSAGKGMGLLDISVGAPDSSAKRL